MSGSPHLEFLGIDKVFPGVHALEDVSFQVSEGSVHALVGENGAGKSTLLNILSGVFPPTKGVLKIAGRERRFDSSMDAIRAGVAVIYQELHLVPELSVEENLFLGHLPHRFSVVQSGTLRRDAVACLDRLGEAIHPAVKLRNLPIAQKQMVEIAKALSRGAKIVAFDEPTSSLSERETKKLFSLIRGLKEKGHVVLYVSHRMEDIFEICDAVTVLRDGRRIKTFTDMNEVTQDILIRHMVGRDIHDIYGYTPRPRQGVALEVREVAGPGLREAVSFSVAKGEILGFFGLVGAGRTELMRLIYGATPKTGGEISLLGKPRPIRSPGDAIRAGLMLCPEDRKVEGVVPIASITDNLNLSARRNHLKRGGVIDEAWERENAEEKIRELGIRTPSARQKIRFLSGGNQQKVILARWLSEKVSVVILDEPTRGIDVGAKSEIYSTIYALAQKGAGVIVVSSDLPEVMGISDRIAVMREGRLSATFTREQATEENILAAAIPSSDTPSGE